MNGQKKTTSDHRQKSTSASQQKNSTNAARQISTNECQQTSTHAAQQKTTTNDRQRSTTNDRQNSTRSSLESRRRLRLILSILLVLAAFWLGRQDFLQSFLSPAGETQGTKVVELGAGDAVGQAAKEGAEQRQASSDKPGDEKQAGQQSIVQESAAKDSAGRVPLNQKPADQKSADQAQAGQEPAGQEPAIQKSADQEPADKEAAAQKRTVQEQNGEKSAAQESENPRSPEFVASVLRKTGKLPDRFLSKKEARQLGWVPEQGNLNEVAPGKSIGGDHFGNYEGKLPEKKGRSYREADVHDSPNRRGAERLVFSNDGLIFYTPDHYKTFYDVSERFPGKKLP